MLGRRGTRVRSGPVRVRYLADGPAPAAAYAIPSSAGGAVVRNRCRRRLRAALHELDREAPIPPGAYLVAVGGDGVALDYHELRGHLARIVEQVRSAR